MTRHTALIYFNLDLVGGLEKSRVLLSRFGECGDIVAISAVYKRYLSSERIDLSARMEFVLRFDTALSVEQVLYLVLETSQFAENNFSKRGSTDLTLLTFDDLIQMSPRLTLPYPQLHQDPLVIRCAAEAWGQYEHPVYQKNLSEIAKVAGPAKQAEFYLQGKSLIDF